MANLTRDRSRLLDKLISDCITFRLKAKEAIEYIRKECTGCPISERTYFRRRKRLLSDRTRDSWFSYFCRIGFVEIHKKVMEDLQMIQDDSLRRLYEEKFKPEEKRDDNLILKLKKDIRENCLMLSEFSVDTPVIAGVKARLDKADRGLSFHYNNY